MLNKINVYKSTPRDKITDYNSIISNPQAIRYITEYTANRPAQAIQPD